VIDGSVKNRLEEIRAQIIDKRLKEVKPLSIKAEEISSLIKQQLEHTMISSTSTKLVL
jgi:uncharacterized protein YlaN (UPF0358 family)